MNKKTILIVSILFYFSFAQAESDNTKTSDIFWGSASQVTLENIQFKNVDKESVSRHDFEKRGFVSVPFDYQIPSKGKIDIFYRLIPTQNPTDGAEDKPILVVMNGGPGSPSSTYRSLDYNYVTREGKDAYQYLSKYFHILAIDQRGTGYSAPLDLESATLSAPAIAKYFDADEHAKDHASVINQVISENKPFFILARSYGGHIGFKYLEMSDTVQKPQGFIFASALQPEMDAVELFVKRREKQRTLNLLIAQDSPKTVLKLSSLREKLKSMNLNPDMVNYLWSYLGSETEWINSLDLKLDSLMQIEHSEQMEHAFSSSMMSTVNLLNYVLSSSSLTPGFTDSTIVPIIKQSVPFDSWMLDESWTLTQIGNGSWQDEFIRDVDANPPPPTMFEELKELRRYISETKVLFTFGRTDSFLDHELQLQNAKRFNVEGHTEYKVFDGGHGAAFSEQGAKYIANWTEKIIKKKNH